MDAPQPTARERILACSRELYSNRTFAQVSLRDIAEAAGVSVALVVNHFGSKDGLFEATVDFTSSSAALLADPLADLDVSLDAMARAWTQVLAAVAGVELPADAPMPRGWEGSATLGEDAASPAIAEFDPDWVMATRPHAALVQTSRAVFPYRGLPVYG